MKYVSRKFFRLSFFVFVMPFFFVSGLFADGKYSFDQEQGFESYRKNNWTDAMFFLRKAVASPSGYDAETLYMLVMSEMNGGEYMQALQDASLFLQKFPDSFYVPYMQFQKGKALHLLNRNEEAVLVLSDFCHQNQDSELYPSALYWIAECFYEEYNFESARSMYERIAGDFPECSRAVDSKYRIEMIAQRQREEKLVYLLKVTGEENIAAREEYERQLKLLQTEDKLGLKKALSDAEDKISSLEEQLALEKKHNEQLSSKNSELEVKNKNLETSSSGKENQNVSGQKHEDEQDYPLSVYTSGYSSQIYDSEVEALKRKARQLQYLLDQQRNEEK